MTNVITKYMKRFILHCILILYFNLSTYAESPQIAMCSAKPILQRLASFAVKKQLPEKNFSLVVSKGSVVDFLYPANIEKSAIVNAANEGCLGGGGVDGAISTAGGENLAQDRFQLPIVRGSARCPTGDAKITGPNAYGNLNVPYVIHAVGPNYWDYEGIETTADELLRSAYTNSLERAKEHKLEGVGFSLLSSGIFKGNKSKEDVLKIGVQAVLEFESYAELKQVHLCAFSFEEGELLQKIASDLELESDMQ